LVTNAIHFRVECNGEIIHQLTDAFVYHWRLWSVPELRDAMRQAGFRATEVHLTYGAAIDGQGNPVPAAAREWEPIDGDYVAYVVARTAPASRSGR
jgi:hypothetical protein